MALQEVVRKKTQLEKTQKKKQKQTFQAHPEPLW
jgi:hypothetical protein